MAEEFEQLRQLLALKRHEEPPPGYFDRLATRIVGELEPGGAVPMPELSWWDRLWAVLEGRPWLAGAYGLLMGCVAIVGISFFQTEGSTATRFSLDSPHRVLSQSPQMAAEQQPPSANGYPATLVFGWAEQEEDSSPEPANGMGMMKRGNRPYPSIRSRVHEGYSGLEARVDYPYSGR